MKSRFLKYAFLTLAFVTKASASPYDYESVPVQESRPSSQAFVQAEEGAPTNDIQTKVNTLENEVQQLRGQIEILQHELGLLNQTKAEPVSSTPSHVEALPSKSEESEPEAYQAAYHLLESKNYIGSAKAFKAFIKDQPNHSLVPNAHYWLGEIDTVQGQDDLALKEYQIITTQFKGSNKCPDAYFKMALLYIDQSEIKKAKIALIKAKEAYPDGPIALLAERKLQELN